MIDFWVPEQSSGEIVTIDRLQAAPAQSGAAQWLALKGARAFPARAEPRLLGPLLRHVILVRVLEGGADYEYRIVGNALVQGGFKENFAGRRISAIIDEMPKFGLGLRMLYDMVRASGEPMGYRGWVGRDMPGAEFAYHESAILPFGEDEAQVDHILIIAALVSRLDMPPRPGTRGP